MTIRGKNATISAKKNSASIHGSMAFASRSISIITIAHMMPAHSPVINMPMMDAPVIDT